MYNSIHWTDDCIPREGSDSMPSFGDTAVSIGESGRGKIIPPNASGSPEELSLGITIHDG